MNLNLRSVRPMICTYTYVYEDMDVIVHYYTIKQDPGCPFKLYVCKKAKKLQLIGDRINTKLRNKDI